MIQITNTFDMDEKTFEDELTHPRDFSHVVRQHLSKYIKISPATFCLRVILREDFFTQKRTLFYKNSAY